MVNARKSLSLWVLVALLAGLLPLAAAARPSPSDAARPAADIEAGLPAGRGEAEPAGFGWQLRLGPLARRNHAVAYDSARGVTVLFGGTSGSSETWEWDGVKWTERFPAHQPMARSSHAMAYDSARGVTVLFGGHWATAGWIYLGDTWEWDGTDWTRRSAAHSPSVREAHAMAYDSARGVTVLFGGHYHYSEPGHEYDSYYGDTWEWDGTDWIERSPAIFPDGRSSHAMAYDSVREVTVLFGGYYGGSETWEWDGVHWTQRSPVHQPTARNLHAMAYDSAREVTVLFGGYDGSYQDDTWEWDGTDWTERSPATKPAARDCHALAYDSAQGVTVLFGGFRGITQPSFDDTWDWDGVNWIKRAPLNKPAPRNSHALVYDSARGVTVLFGGRRGSQRLYDTWEWDGMDWIQPLPVNHPTWRYGHGMAYDSARGVTVLFGGWAGSLQDDTWEWDGVNWTQRSPVHKPAARYLHTLAYDSARGVAVLFGGYDGSDRFDDTWEWDGTDWIQRSPAHKATARTGHGLAYDGARGVTVLFGGTDGSRRLNDTWEWDGTDWTQRSPTHTPTARTGHALAYDSRWQVTVLFGGYDGSYRDDTWEWDGTDWTQLSPVHEPTARDQHSLAYDGARGVTVLFGGAISTGELNDTWEYRPPPLPAPALGPIDNADEDGNYLVAWSTVAGALGYTLQEDVGPGFFAPVIRYEGSGTQVEIAGQPEGTWYYRVRAENLEGESYWSDSQAVEVLPAAPARVYLPLVVKNP